jgi:ankyrin repeat protein
MDIAVLQATLLSASHSVSPSVAEFSLSQRPVQYRLPSLANAPDIISSAPCLAWALLVGQALRPIHDFNTDCGVFRSTVGSGIHIVTRSPGGVLLGVDYCSAKQLAEAWLLACESTLSPVACFYTTTRNGEILITSRAAFIRQNAVGNLLCSICGSFFSGLRGAGLKRHAQVAHGASLVVANEARNTARYAIMLAPTQSAAWTPTEALLHATVSCATHPIPGFAAISAFDSALSSPATMHPLLTAAKEGDLATFRSIADGLGLHDPPASCRDVRDARGSNALHYAAGGGHLDIVRALVADFGFDATAAQRSDRRSAVHWAARNGHCEVLAWLVEEAGAAPDAPTADGTTPFHFAAWQGHVHVLQWLVSHTSIDEHALNKFRCNAAHWAVMGGRADVAAWLAHRGHDMGLVNANGHSLLHKAAQKGHAALAVWLLGGPRCAAFRAATEEGRMAEYCSPVSESSLGPPLTARHVQADSEGYTPSAQAAACGFAELASLLGKVEEQFRTEEPQFPSKS